MEDKITVIVSEIYAIMTQSKYFGTTVKNQYHIHEEITTRLALKNAR
jgi:hypothetical protein